MTHPHRGTALLLALTTGCFGDLTESAGDLGNLSYGLSTDYEGGVEALTDLPLMTGYRHHILVSLTSDGEAAAEGNADQIVHAAAGAEIEIEETDVSNDPPDFDILAAEPGEVKVTSTLYGEVFDRVRLQLDDPTSLEIVAWTRAPWKDEWKLARGALRVEEGTQISFLAIPEADGERLGGEFTPTIELDLPELAVPDVAVLAIQEGGMTTGGEPVTFYAIEPGTVTFTFSEPVHGVEAVRTVEILPLASP